MAAPKEAAQLPDIADRLFNLFIGNEHRHLKNFGPPVQDKKTFKWTLDVKTHDGPATLALWRSHLDQGFILSIIPLLDNGTCWWGSIDVDEYDVNVVSICRLVDDWKLPLIPVRSKSGGLHLFIFFKGPISATRIIPALHFLAQRLGLKKYEIFPSSAKIDHASRGITMPYGPTWDRLYEQCGLAVKGGSISLKEFVDDAEAARITASELPEAPKESSNTTPTIPLALQAAIDSMGPYPGGDRSQVTGSIIWSLFDRGLDGSAVKALVEHRGPFVRYDEKGRNLEDDITRIGREYLKRYPNKKGRIEICTDIVPWDPSPPPTVSWDVDELIATGSVTSVVGDSGVKKSFWLWNMAVCLMFGLPFAHRDTKRSGVMMWLAEGNADYRQRCRAALKAAGQDTNQRLPLLLVNDMMLPLVAEQSEGQIAAMIDKADAWLKENFDLALGTIFIDTLSMAALFTDVYKPNEVIDVHGKFVRAACHRGKNVVHSDHFNKKDKSHPSGTLHKRNVVDQLIRLEGGRMTLDKSRYGRDKTWNTYRSVQMDDGNGNRTLALEFGPTQYPDLSIDVAMMFASALSTAQRELNGKLKVSVLQDQFTELHVDAQIACNIKSKNPKEMARSAFCRELDAAEKTGWVKVDKGLVWERDINE